MYIGIKNKSSGVLGIDDLKNILFGCWNWKTVEKEIGFRTIASSPENWKAILDCNCSSEIFTVLISSLQQSSVADFDVSFSSSQQQLALSNKLSEAKLPLQ